MTTDDIESGQAFRYKSDDDGVVFIKVDLGLCSIGPRYQLTPLTGPHKGTVGQLIIETWKGREVIPVALGFSS